MNTLLSSSSIKEIAVFKGDYERFVPKAVAEALKKKYETKQTARKLTQNNSKTRKKPVLNWFSLRKSFEKLCITRLKRW